MKRLKFFRALLAAALTGLVILVASLFWLQQGLPASETLRDHFYTPSVLITDRYGRTLWEVLPEEGGRHKLVALDKIPLLLRQATVATEDHTFYANPGVDLPGIIRSLWLNLRQGETVSGASTITQQVARNLLLPADERGQRTLVRKMREALIAWQLTRKYSKNDILEIYLNQTYYGAMAYGVEAAAQTYFGKPVEELDLAEAALIAGLPQSPGIYNPFTNLEAAQERQRVVLSLMEKQGVISAGQRHQAEREVLQFSSSPYPLRAPHFVLMVQAQLDQMFTTREIYDAGGLVVRTSLNLDWQYLAEQAIQRQMEDLRRSDDGLGHNLNNAALVALDSHSGEVLALVGSPDYFDRTHAGAINMAISPRQPGSALKPVVYAAAMDPSQPDPWTAATMLLDVRTTFTTHEAQPYTPANYDLQEHGPVLVRQALASSLNIPAVLTLDHVGLPRMFELAHRLGLDTLQDPDDYDLSLALGGGAVRLIDLTGAYAAFANGGYRVDPTTILAVMNAAGEEITQAPGQPTLVRVLDERVAWLVTDILADKEARSLGFGPNSILNLDRPAAVKTGTTSNFHDNWAIGYTPDLVVGVWAGNTSYAPMREVNGLAGAAPVWHTFMRAVLTGTPQKNFPQPPGLVQREVCALTGYLPSQACPYHRSEWFILGTEPIQIDPIYQLVTLDRRTGHLAGNATPADQRVEKVVLDLPAQAAGWAHQNGLVLLADLQASPALVDRVTNQSLPLTLVAPPSGSIYFLSEALPGSAQRLQFQAIGEPGLSQVTIWIDDQILAVVGEPPYQAWWELQPGEHEAWAEAVRSNGEPFKSEPSVFIVK